ncbi:MAG: hypothetical protein AMXMBFR64_40860 [Myxococcales bacterium]
MTEHRQTRERVTKAPGEDRALELEALRALADQERPDRVMARWGALLERSCPVQALSLFGVLRGELVLLVGWADPHELPLPPDTAPRRSSPLRPGAISAHSPLSGGAELAELLRYVAGAGVCRVDAADAPDVAKRLAPAGAAGRTALLPLVSGERTLGLLLAVVKSERASALGALSTLAGAASVLAAIVLARAGSTPEPPPGRADERARAGELDIVGETQGLREVMGQVARVAPLDVPVLVLGETGSGKEMIARAIHARSARSAGPVVRVNCGAIPPELVDSELFGHERGSFTGATGTRQGWFERADGGTLFLDEVGELPLPAQVRLLRVLQDGTFHRVGGHKTLHADVRIVTATHRDLRAMVQSGTFREDLWYRVGVFPLRLPPLRERLEDLPALARHFARLAGERLGAGFLAPTDEDLRLLARYPWPGNVRELASVIERAAILGHARRLDVASALSLGLSSASPGASGAEREPATARSSSDPSQDTLDAAMVRQIEAALARSFGRIEGPAGAAAILGINPHTLRSRMRKLGVEWSRFRPHPPGVRMTEP